MKVVSTKLTNPEWEALMDKCNERGMTIAEHLRELIHQDSNPIMVDNSETNMQHINQADRNQSNGRTQVQHGSNSAALSRMLGLDKQYRK